METLQKTPVPFDDTYVLYDPTDPLSFICAGLSLLPIGILCFYLSWFIVTRELEPCIMACGQVFNDVLNNIVKNHVKHPRPRVFEGFQQNGLRSGYGMPSAHAQFMGFFFTYLTLRLWLQWRGLTTTRRLCGTLALATVSCSVIFARVYLHYHSVPQVLVGTCIGSSLGVTFFFIGTMARTTGLTNWVLSWSISDFLSLKDTCFFEPESLAEQRKQWLTRRQQQLQHPSSSSSSSSSSKVE